MTTGEWHYVPTVDRITIPIGLLIEGQKVEP